jgi:hypothetical protein
VFKNRYINSNRKDITDGTNKTRNEEYASQPQRPLLLIPDLEEKAAD